MKSDLPPENRTVTEAAICGLLTPETRNQDISKRRNHDAALTAQVALDVPKGERSYTMTRGDSLQYFGVNPHCRANRTNQPARILWVGRMRYARSGATAQHGIPDATGNGTAIPMQPQAT